MKNKYLKIFLIIVLLGTLFYVPDVFAWEGIDYNFLSIGYSQVNVTQSVPLDSQHTTSYTGNLNTQFILSPPYQDNSGILMSFARDIYFVLGTNEPVVAGHTYVLTFGIRRSSAYVTRSLSPYIHDDAIESLYIGDGTTNHLQNDVTYSWRYDQDLSTYGMLDIVTIKVKANVAGTGFVLRLGNSAITDHFMYVNATQNNSNQFIQLWTAQIVDAGADPSLSMIAEISNQLSDINNNMNQNTQTIINNQNQNTQQQIESQQVCSNTIIDNSKISINGYLDSSGNVQNVDTIGITDYINVDKSDIIIIKNSSVGSGYSCFYNSSKVLISCFQNNQQPVNSSINIPNNTSFARFSIVKNGNYPNFSLYSCKNGNQALNDTLTDSDSTGASAHADANFSDFQFNSHGLSAIFNTIVSFLTDVTSSTCSSLSFTLPFVHNEVTLPCMSSIYTTHFPVFLSLYQLITTGLIAYRVIINLFQKVKQLADPNYDKIEVVQL